MHQQEIAGVLIPAHLMHNTAAHGESGNARRSHHGVYLVLAEQVQYLCKHYTAHGIEYESHKAQQQYNYGFHGYEHLGLHSEGYRNTQHQRDKAREALLGGFGQAVQHAALTDKVAEHQESDELCALGSNGAGDNGNKYGEEYAGGLGHRLGVVWHAYHALLLGGAGFYYGRLNDGHQRHVAVCSYHDSALIL